jgi:eukaryotic-like serine/threonine-protein kinase
VAAPDEKSAGEAVAETLPGEAREPPPEPPFLVDNERYQVVEVLGRGGMGQVCKAFDPRLGRHVALKIMREAGPDFARRLVHEARAQARVDHPNVCKVYGVGEMDGKPFISLQYIEGTTLKEAAPRMTRDELIRLLRDVADALHAAHRQGLVHRDVKPANILVERTADGFKPYVTDFGIARQIDAPGMTKTGVAQGTPLYMAPEQARGDQQKIDRRTDVYALGVVLYEVLTRRHPFTDDTSIGVMLKVLSDEVVGLRTIDPSVPADLETITLKCLEKDPARRYDSAKALSQDLQAWLDGEPIHARAASFSYRIYKRARKHRALLMTAALVVAVGVGLGGYAWRVRAMAGRQAALAQSFGQEVERNDAVGRYAALLPLHDTRRERRIIEERMREMSRRMSELGAVAEGPGHYALGRGYLTLDRPDDARRELLSAWAVDYRTPEVSYALGLAYGELYQQAITELERSGDPDVEAKRRAELEKTLREPALQYLKQASHSDAPEYVEGLIALHERRFAEALDKARAAQARVPWLFEAFTLEGDTQVAAGRYAWDKGEPDDALAALERAGRGYRAALEIGHSSVSALGGECRRLAFQSEILYHHGKELKQVVDGALAACDRALVALPDDVEAQVAKSAALVHLGRWQSAHAEDPKQAFEASVALAERAAGAAPKDVHALLAHAVAEQGYADHLAAHGEDPRAHADRAIAAARAVTALEPRSFEGYTVIARSWNDRGDWEGAHGEDPRRSYDTAAASGTEALRLLPSGFDTANTVGEAWFGKGMWETVNGEDATRSLQNAAEQFQAVVRINPKVDYGFVNLCGVWETLGEHQMKRRVDPMPSLLKAIAACEQAVGLDPNWSGTWLNLGCAHYDVALWRTQEGLDPGAKLEEARAAMKQALRVDPEYELALRYDGLVEILAGRWAMMHGRSPEADFAAAQKLLDHAARAQAQGAEAHAALAELHRRRAEWLASKGQPVAAEVAAGLREADGALKVHPRLASAVLASAALHLVLARTEKGASQKEAQARARASVDKALSLDGNLRHEAAPIVDELARLP